MSTEGIPALRVEGYGLNYGAVPALAGIDLRIGQGETLGLVGASGSGKTSLAWAILRMLPPSARESGGKILLGTDELRAMPRRQMAKLRGRRIGMVFQDPSTSLNPALRLGTQLTEVLRRHQGLGRRAAVAQAEEWLAHTGLPDPRGIMQRYPHQASGGEKQRVVIATAFACRPELIIFDEPTTALDVITAARIVELFARLRAEARIAALYISHDLPLVARVAGRVAVLEGGRIVEEGPAEQVLAAPAAPATRRLLDAIPSAGHRLVGPATATAGLLQLDDVTVTYGRRGRLGRLLGLPAPVDGARGVSLGVADGEILGVLGESGSGKSTLARAISGLAPYRGGIGFAGALRAGGAAMPAAWRRQIQLVFQNPDASLNPRHRVGTILSRPLRLAGVAAREVGPRVAAMLEEVGLPADFAGRHPHELSGGQKQRVAIARAFAAAPRLVLCDEVTAALDVVVQAEIARLLVALQARHGTAFLFITHDVALVRQLAHRVAVMYRGELVDLFAAQDFTAPDRHPYTKALLAAAGSATL